MNVHLFSDADNTLWDTNSVFARAQFSMLRNIEQLTKQSGPARSRERLAFLREIDQLIASQHPDHLHYPPILLAQALLLTLRGATAEEASSVVLSQSETQSHLDSIVERFVNELRRVPRLRRGVHHGLWLLRQTGIDVTVVTETRRDRCIGLLETHQILIFVSDIVAVRKSPETYTGLAAAHPSSKAIMVGDQLDRDILFSAQAGFETFYFPSAFQPHWTQNLRVRPDHEIHRFDEILDFIRD